MKQEIMHWDGKSVSVITAIYQSYQQKEDFIRELLPLISVISTQNGATWCLKHFFQQQGRLEPQEIEHVYSFLPLIHTWQAKLHILQSIPYMPIPVNFKKPVEGFLRDGLTDTNKFVRAWSYAGFYELSQQYPEYQAETQQFLEMAMRDEAASVKARIRQVLKCR